MMLFDSLRRSLPALAALAVIAASAAAAQAAVTQSQGASVPGGKIRHCHGYVRHVSTENIRVHCVDGVPADLSFLYAPNFKTLFSNGKSVQTKDLKPNTTVHVEFTQSLGIRKAYKIYVTDPHGHGKYGFKS
jgi:predicted transglutaminase-like cysteine proteinase